MIDRKFLKGDRVFHLLSPDSRGTIVDFDSGLIVVEWDRRLGWTEKGVARHTTNYLVHVNPLDLLAEV
jgi:hypothetical protein